MLLFLIALYLSLIPTYVKLVVKIVIAEFCVSHKAFSNHGLGPVFCKFLQENCEIQTAAIFVK